MADIVSVAIYGKDADNQWEWRIRLHHSVGIVTSV